MISTVDIYNALRTAPQTLEASALGSFADLRLFEGQAGGSPRERLIDL